MKVISCAPWWLAGFSVAGIITACQTGTKTSDPNVVLILMDDLGYGDLTCNGAIGYRTPNIDRLAIRGLRFTNYYAAQAVSGASRAGLLTGCYPNRIGLTGAPNHNARHGISPDEMTIAELLKQKGYATGMVGKWHLGHLRPFLPLQHGFDEFLGLPYSNDMWPQGYEPDDSGVSPRAGYPPLPLIDGNDTIDYIESLRQMDTLTTLYTNRAVEFIHKHSGRPFFLYIAHSMVHTPLAVSDRFKGKSRQGRFGDVMMEVDWSIGEIVAALKKQKVLDNTLIIFTSDNGPWLNFGAHAGSSGGFREGKGTTFEGGQRVPCLMSWPRIIPQGEVSGQLITALDILPTLAAITGTSLPDHIIDGLDFSAVLKGDLESEPRSVFYYYYNRNSLEAVRSNHWKLVLPHPTRTYAGVLPRDDGKPGPYASIQTSTALYDLRRDPGEWYDVKDLYPEIMNRMDSIIKMAREDLGDDLTGMEGKNRRQPGKIPASTK